jgi:hypothetical protein
VPGWSVSVRGDNNDGAYSTLLVQYFYGVSKFDMSEASKQRAASHHHVILNSDASGPTGTIYDGLKSHNWDLR